MASLQTIHVSKSYANHKALDQVSINIPDRSIFGLLGPNGAGKTTLIRIINLISILDEGEVLLNGKSIKPADTATIGYLPEERGLYKKMKVGEQALYLAQLKGLSKHDARKRLKFWFEKFEIDSWWHRKVEELSKGMQQKIQFITTVLHQPQLLIFDEPFSGFDPINVNLLKKEILQLREDGATIIFSTHNMASVEELCDNIALINNGKTILQGEINEIKERYKSNMYRISYRSSKELLFDPTAFHLIETELKNKHRQSLVKIAEGQTPNDLVKQLLTQAELVSFEEVLPSVNDIFIQEVNQHR